MTLLLVGCGGDVLDRDVVADGGASEPKRDTVDPASTTASTTTVDPARVAAMGRAYEICEDFGIETGRPSSPVVTGHTTAGEITHDLEQSARAPLAPWDELPPDTFVAYCGYDPVFTPLNTYACEDGGRAPFPETLRAERWLVTQELTHSPAGEWDDANGVTYRRCDET